MSIRLDSIRPASRRIRFGTPVTIFIEVKRIVGAGALDGTVTLSCGQAGASVEPTRCDVRIPADSDRAVIPVDITLKGGSLEMLVVHSTLTVGGLSQVQSCVLEVEP